MAVRPNIRVVPPPRHVQQAAIGGAAAFTDFVSGAFGYVRAHLITQAAVTVELRTGIFLHAVKVPARGWVHDTDDGKSTGGVDLPPLGTLVFVLFPYGQKNTSGAMVLVSFLDPLNKKHQEFLKEGEEAKQVEILDGGLKVTYDRAAPSFTLEDIEDAKLKITIDKAAKKIQVTDWSDNKITADSNGLKLEGKGNTVSLETGKTLINGHLEISQ